MEENQFKGRKEVQQITLRYEHSNPGQSGQNYPMFSGQFHRLPRPNFTSPNQFELNVCMSGQPDQTQLNFSEPFMGSRLPILPPQQPTTHLQPPQNQLPPQDGFGASNTPQVNLNMPPPQFNPNMPFSQVNLNRPPPPIRHIFNPNFPPPPMQHAHNSFRPSDSEPRGVFPQPDASSVQFSFNKTRPFLQNACPPSSQSANYINACTAVNEEMKKDSRQKQEDKQWVAEWTKHIRKKGETRKSNTLTVSTVVLNKNVVVEIFRSILFHVQIEGQSSQYVQSQIAELQIYGTPAPLMQDVKNWCTTFQGYYVHRAHPFCL